MQCLQFAEDYFALDGNKWGLGLTYNLLGRLYVLKQQSGQLVEENLAKSKEYYELAISNFTEVEHFRGAYMSSKDLYDLRQQYLINFTDQRSKRAQKMAEQNQTHINKYSLYKCKFQYQQQTYTRVKN